MNLLEQGLEGMFYIICVNEANDWWQLRKTDDHQVVSCGRGKDFILQSLQRQVEKYRTKDELRRQWSSLQYTRPLNETTKSQRGLEYEVVKDISEQEISKIVTSSKENSFRRRRVDVPHVPIEEEAEEEITKPKIGTIRRRRLVRK